MDFPLPSVKITEILPVNWEHGTGTYPRKRSVVAMSEQSSDGTECEKTGCTNDAVAVYEGIIPPADTVRKALCHTCATPLTGPPIRYVETGTTQNGGDS